jgi:hypothetical protein
MGIRENLQKLTDKKQAEIGELELQIREGKAYIQAMQDSMKLLPRDGAAAIEHTLRPGSGLAKARDAIRTAGGPLPIADILKAIGKPQDKKHRVSLAGTLSGYARDGKIFEKTAPNTFGLLEMRKSPFTGDNAAQITDDDIPEDFGAMH